MESSKVEINGLEYDRKYIIYNNNNIFILMQNLKLSFFTLAGYILFMSYISSALLILAHIIYTLILVKHINVLTLWRNHGKGTSLLISKDNVRFRGEYFYYLAFVCSIVFELDKVLFPLHHEYKNVCYLLYLILIGLVFILNYYISKSILRKRYTGIITLILLIMLIGIFSNILIPPKSPVPSVINDEPKISIVIFLFSVYSFLIISTMLITSYYSFYYSKYAKTHKNLLEFSHEMKKFTSDKSE